MKALFKRIVLVGFLLLSIIASVNASENSLPIIGDVNGDREVNIADINAVINIILGKDASADFLRRADVNKDDEINISDVNRIIEIILNS